MTARYTLKSSPLPVFDLELGEAVNRTFFAAYPGLPPPPSPETRVCLFLCEQEKADTAEKGRKKKSGVQTYVFLTLGFFFFFFF